jgi:hypothetical protein
MALAVNAEDAKHSNQTCEIIFGRVYLLSRAVSGAAPELRGSYTTYKQWRQDGFFALEAENANDENIQ